jgi:hypothetical protein
MIKQSYLKYLIGQIIQRVDTDISTVIPLNQKKEEYEQIMSVYTQIYFDEYILDVYNKAEILGGTENMRIEELIGLKVIDTNETKEKAELIFGRGFIFKIDLRDEAYSNDPEAMCLHGPNNLCVVWN